MSLSEHNSIRMQAEGILLDSEERVRLILDSASEAICGCDSEGTCSFVNPSAARIVEYDDPAELVGKNTHALEHIPEKTALHIQLTNVPSILVSQKRERPRVRASATFRASRS
jgi:formate hydrogenlyase transcriptional activator